MGKGLFGKLAVRMWGSMTCFAAGADQLRELASGEGDNRQHQLQLACSWHVNAHP